MSNTRQPVDAKAILAGLVYPPNVDLGGDTLVQVVVVAAAVAEDLGELLAGARASVNLERLASLVVGAGGRLGLTPELARTCVDAEDERVQALAHRALDEAVGDEAELAVDDVHADEGALILVVGVLLHEASSPAGGSPALS